jgi:DnaK suppressor protein
MDLDTNIVERCRGLLLEEKSDIMTRMQASREEFYSQDFGRDEIDQSSMAISEFHFLQYHKRMRHRLIEIEAALQRIQEGGFGVCEETMEPIERDRLLAMPWTRLSIEGAELREAKRSRRA